MNKFRTRIFGSQFRVFAFLVGISVLRIDNDNDRVILGSATPNFVMGLNNTFKYRNFDLRVFMYWRQGQMLHSEANGYGSYRIQGDPGIKVNYWTPENPTNEFPRPEKSYSDSSKLESLGYVDGSYLKIKEITLGYQLPKSWIEKGLPKHFWHVFTCIIRTMGKH